MQSIEERRAYYRIWYHNNKARIRDSKNEQSAKRRAAIRAWLNEKKNNPCTDCGITYPSYVMQYDHVRGKKRADIAELVRCEVRYGVIEAELTKCELVCANCHAIRTHNRRQNFIAG